MGKRLGCFGGDMFRKFLATLFCAASVATAAGATTTYNGQINGIWYIDQVDAGETLFLEVEFYPNQQLSPGSLVLNTDHFYHTAWFEYEYWGDELVYAHIERDIFENDEYCDVSTPKSCSTSVMTSSFDGTFLRAKVSNTFPSLGQSTPCPGPPGRNARGGCENYSMGVLFYMYTNAAEPIYAKVRYRIAGEVPEPSTWALMILGFGAVGGALRRRRSWPA